MSRSLLFLLTLITPPLAACGGADPEPQTQAQEIPDPAPGTETLPTEEVGESTPPPATQPARQPEPEAPSAQRPLYPRVSGGPNPVRWLASVQGHDQAALKAVAGGQEALQTEVAQSAQDGGDMGPGKRRLLGRLSPRRHRQPWRHHRSESHTRPA